MGIRKATKRRAASASAKSTVSEKTKATEAISQENLNSLIAETAYGLFEKRGYGHGNDLGDWCEAEQIVLKSVR